MKLEFKKQRRTLIVNVKGELDHHNSQKFKDEIEDQFTKRAVRNIILDLKNLNFMDSSGVGVILGRYRKVKELDGEVAVININKQVKRVFEVSGLSKIIKIYQNELDALNSLEGV
ncbi:MAG: hypothetical protein PWP21_184 [Thermosediminibacterales bacterium]|nr:hypothetical protein [Thermosediminibacterales bacterium]